MKITPSKVLGSPDIVLASDRICMGKDPLIFGYRITPEQKEDVAFIHKVIDAINREIDHYFSTGEKVPSLYQDGSYPLWFKNYNDVELISKDLKGTLIVWIPIEFREIYPNLRTREEIMNGFEITEYLIRGVINFIPREAGDGN